jgi:hypothetical protein
MAKRVSGWFGGMVFVVAVACLANSASAQIGFGAGGYGLGFYNYGRAGVMQQDIPYYALYPPVYYSQPVPRTYGYSPFAYPPGVMTPDVAPPQPEVIKNPYVPLPPPTKPTSDQHTNAPRIYRNPYVKQAQVASEQSLQRRTAE